MVKVVLTVLIVLAVVAIGGLLHLPARAVRALFQYGAAPAH
jgi:DMSO reductase anchor subunit